MGDQKQEGIKVTDRRRFSADGTLVEVGHQEAAETARPEPAEAFQSVSDSASAPGQAAPESPLFLDFMTGLISGAASHLGLVPHPVSGKSEVDLSGAKQMIDILTVLQEKTQGNLAPAEKQLLENALTELRLVYVKCASSSK